MESKPIVTCHGDQALFSSLHAAVVQGLPRESLEWRRSYGRAPRSVYVEANFVPFSVDILPKETDWSLISRPFFHMYWTDCDLDTYKSTVRDDITNWLTRLRACNIVDWMIVVVVQDESKVKSKLLPRTSVIDKVKSDFCGRQGERCIVLSEPFKTDLKSAESWGNLLLRMRTLLLQAFNRSLVRFEDYMRSQRERRTEKGWNFCQYFMLQEELAFMFEILGLFEESLVQYDELDALFTQFVLNHAAGDSAEWLACFTESTIQTWDGLSLARPINWEMRELIRKNKSSLLEFRNYLFSRQCALLLLLFRPWEVAQRSIPYMHNCIQELKILEIQMPPGAVACWVFLSCLEIVQTCDKFKDSSQVEAYSLYTASLWEYARKKLQELGELCGLMPDVEPNSHQLNMVVDLISGMGTSSSGEQHRGPMEKLREALSSKESFHKHYLELSELAMGTFKHIGRIRSARMIGRDLAAFYMKLGEPHKAEGFLNDALNTFKQESWDMLADHIRLEIAQCQKILNNNQSYARSCMYITSSPTLDLSIRKNYYQEMMAVAHTKMDVPIYLRSNPVFLVKGIQPKANSFVIDKEVHVTVSLTSNLLEPIQCDSISVCLNQQGLDLSSSLDLNSSSRSVDSLGFRNRRRHTSVSSTNSMDLNSNHNHNQSCSSLLDIQAHLEYRPDKALLASSLVYKSGIKRSDSSGGNFREREVVKDDFTLCLNTDNVVLQPGENNILLKGKLEEKGTYTLTQLCFKVDNLELLKTLPQDRVGFDIICDEPSMILTPYSEKFIAGIPQYFILKLFSGSLGFDSSSQLQLSASDGLSVKFEDKDEGAQSTLPVDKMEPHKTSEWIVQSRAELPLNKDYIDHQINIRCDWFSDVFLEEVTFRHPFQINHKVHTAGKKKYVQILVHGKCERDFKLLSEKLECTSPDVTLVGLNHPNPKRVNEELSASFMWQLQNNVTDTPVLQCTFSMDYQLVCEGCSKQTWVCKYQFDICEYKTLYIVKSEVLPTLDKESCRTGEVCYMQINVTGIDEMKDSVEQLLYEAIPENQYWAASGKTSGVFELEEGSWDITVQLTPLSGGNLPLPHVKIVRYIASEISSSTDSASPTTDAVLTENSNPLYDDKQQKNKSTEQSSLFSDHQVESSNKTSENDEIKSGDSQADHQEVLSILVPFSHGQVYYGSVGSQVHVMPAQNTSHIDVVVS